MPILTNARKSFDALSGASEDFLRFGRLREGRGFLTRRERWGILNGKDAAKSAQTLLNFVAFLFGRRPSFVACLFLAADGRRRVLPTVASDYSLFSPFNN